jgi:hypothetical protein
MKMIFSILFCCMTYFFLFNSPSAFSATGTGTPETYQVTIKKVELYNSTTGSWVTAGEGALTFNIASASAGQAVGSYVSGKSIPEGVYTQIRVTVSRTMSIKSTGSVGGTTYYTTSSSISGPSGSTAVLASTLSSNYALGTLTAPNTDSPPAYHVVGDDFTTTSTLSPSITVKKGMTKKVRVKFDVTGAVTFDNAAAAPNVICYPNAPTVTFEIVS